MAPNVLVHVQNNNFFVIISGTIPLKLSKFKVLVGTHITKKKTSKDKIHNEMYILHILHILQHIPYLKYTRNIRCACCQSMHYRTCSIYHRKIPIL